LYNNIKDLSIQFQLSFTNCNDL